MSDSSTNIMTGFTGTMTIVGYTVIEHGGPIGGEIGATFNVVNGVIVACIDYQEGTTGSDMTNLEAACVSLISGMAAGWIVGAIAVPLTLGAPAVILISGAAVATTEYFGGDIYNGYKYLQEKLFGLLDILRPIENFDNFFDMLGHKAVDAIDAIKGLFGLAEKEGSPLIFDLDGDGVETTGIKAGTYFDHGGDGFAEETGWVEKDDGLLVLDRNNNGRIDSGKELFGDSTLLANGQKAANGFAALAELDQNNDGLIDVQDAAFADLRVWKDADSDGISQAEELLTLTEAGVKSIATGSTDSTLVDANGNAHKQVGSFTRTDDTTAAVSDVWFAVNRTHSIATEWLDVPDDIAALPDAKGYGQVYDLHQAMVRDQSGALKSLVSQFVAADTATEKNALIDQIIYKWAGVDNIVPNSRGAYIDARKISSLEVFLGEKFSQLGIHPNPYGQAGRDLDQAFDMLEELIYGQLASQTSLKSLYDKINYTWDTSSQTIRGDLTAVAIQLTDDITSDHTAGTADLAEFLRTLKGLGMFNIMDLDSFETSLAPLGNDIATLFDTMLTTTSSPGNDFLRGGAGNDNLSGGTGADSLYGGTGDDILSGGNDNDVLVGGTGNDSLAGGAGDDMFRFNLGDGQDTIGSDDITGTDTVSFGGGISLSDLRLLKNGNDLVIKVGNAGDQVTLLYWYSPTYTSYRMDRFTFADGTVLTREELMAQKPVMGTEGNDTLAGIYDNDWFDGSAGNDNLSGGTGADSLYGGTGDDILSGGNDNDVLVGGTGNDSLAGGAGNDTFVFDTTLSSASNVDSITDFISGLDHIQLDKDVFTTLTDDGALSSDFFRTSTNGVALDENDYFLYNTTSGALFYDADGNGQGVAVRFATLTTKPAVTAADFIIAS
jgi:Ca2+-binding RTX toxin-like protein